MAPVRQRRQLGRGVKWLALTGLAACSETGPAHVPPTVTVSPADTTILAGETVALLAVASHPDSAIPPTSIRWLANDTIAAVGASFVWRPLAPETLGVAAVVVRDDLEVSARDSAVIRVLANLRPVIDTVIVPPRFYGSDSVWFVAAATDEETGPLDGAALRWISDVDGLVAEGDSVMVGGLSDGDHVMTVVASDPQGFTDSATVALRVVPPPPGLVWWRRFPGESQSGAGNQLALADDGTIYVGLAGHPTCFTCILALESDGTDRWTHAMPHLIWDHSSGLTIGPDGTAYILDGGGNAAAVSAGGTLLWEVDSLLGHDPHGRFALTTEGQLYAYGRAEFVRIDPATGADVWRMGGLSYRAGPAVTPDGRIMIQTGVNRVLVSDSSGTVLADTLITDAPWGTIDGWFVAAMDASGSFYLPRNHLSVVTPDGALAWQAVGPSRAEPVIAANGTVFAAGAASDGLLVRAIGSTGTTLWSQTVPRSDQWIPRLTLLADGSLWVAAGWFLHRLEGATGSVLQTIEFTSAIEVGMAVDAAGRLYLITDDNRLVVIQGPAPLPADAPWPTWRRDNRRTASLR